MDSPPQGLIKACDTWAGHAWVTQDLGTTWPRDIHISLHSWIELKIRENLGSTSGVLRFEPGKLLQAYVLLSSVQVSRGLLNKLLDNLRIDTICIFDSVQQTRQSIQERHEVNVAGKRNMTLQKGGLELPPGHFISVSQCETTKFQNGPLNK